MKKIFMMALLWAALSVPSFAQVNTASMQHSPEIGQGKTLPIQCQLSPASSIPVSLSLYAAPEGHPERAKSMAGTGIEGGQDLANFRLFIPPDAETGKWKITKIVLTPNDKNEPVELILSGNDTFVVIPSNRVIPTSAAVHIQ